MYQVFVLCAWVLWKPSTLLENCGISASCAAIRLVKSWQLPASHCETKQAANPSIWPFRSHERGDGAGGGGRLLLRRLCSSSDGLWGFIVVTWLHKSGGSPADD